MAFRDLKYTWVGKIFFIGKQWGSGSETLLCPCKFADLPFAVWDIKEICGIIITSLRICNLGTGTPTKYLYI